MSQNIFCQDGCVRLLSYLNSSIGANLQQGLWVNNFAPVASMHFTDLVEASFPGYARAAQTWGVSPDFSNGARLTQGGHTFTCTSSFIGQFIYGNFFIDSVSGDLIYACRFDSGPFFVSAPGDTVVCTGIWNALSQYQS